MPILAESEGRTVLLLGGSADQLFAIRTARAMGLRALVVDMNADSPGFSIADDHAVVSTCDIPALKHFVDSYQTHHGRISGVLVQGSDIPQVVCVLAEHLGTPHIPLESARLSTHKYRMKCRFRECGVPIPWFSRVETVDQLKEIADERGYPLVIKPVDRSGARGVFCLDENCDLEDLYAQSKALSFVGEVMVEEYLPGLQISTETIMHDGRAYTPGFADRNYEKLKAYAPNIIENGGWVPSCVTPDQRCAIERLVEQAGLALGVTDGVVKGDVVMTPDGPKMIEMATRLSGGDFSESLIPLGCGVNIVEAALNIAMGRAPEIDKLCPQFENGVVNRYFFPNPGQLLRIEGEAEVRCLPWVRKLEFWYRPGDIVPLVKSHADRFGVFIVVGETRKEAEMRARQVYKTIRIITAPV